METDLHEHHQTKVAEFLELCSEILGVVGPVSLDDNFFDLGGDSLIAIELAARASELFEHEIELETIFLTDTLAEVIVGMEDAFR